MSTESMSADAMKANPEKPSTRAYGVALLHDVRFGDEITAYLRGIDATLRPFGGRFVIHGGVPTVLEGTWPPGDLIVIEFPDRDGALGWYRSDEYQKILPLRQENAAGPVILIDGVSPEHVATDVLR